MEAIKHLPAQKRLRYHQPNLGELNDEVQPVGELLAAYQKLH